MTEVTKPKTKGADLSGLDSFTLSSFLDTSKPAPQRGGNQVEAGAISYAPLGNFHEDPENARKEFDPDKLQELADSMQQVNPITGKPRGIMEPLSVKHHPDQPGHLVINGGNRRYRAAGMAGMKEAPYVIKDELDDFDKFVLNDQRENLSPLEIAMFIRARLEDGHKAGEIAKALGRPPSYVSDHKIFFDMTSCIRDLYDCGLCRSMQALALLHRGYKKHGEAVETFCQAASESEQELTTSQVRTFLGSLKEPEKKEPKNEQSAAPIGGNQEQKPQGGDSANQEGDDDPTLQERGEEQSPLTLDGEPLSGGHRESQADNFLAKGEKVTRNTRPAIQVKHDERKARLLPDRRADYGLAWIKYYEGGQEVEVELNQVQLVAIMEY